MLAADAAFEALSKETEGPIVLEDYANTIKDSWVYKELWETRNVRPSFHNPLGLWGGIAYSGLDTLILRGRVPWTFNHPTPDYATLKPVKEVEPIEYPKPDGVISFDLLENVSRTGTNHEENQPIHLRLQRGPKEQIERNYEVYGGPEQKFCPGM